MHEAVASPLEAWANFYVIVGSSAGALTGLQFVVLTLIAQSAVVGRSRESIAAFGSPNVVHFCAALLVAAILSAPWNSLARPGALVAVCGVAGIVYSAVVLMRARRQTGYQPVFEDWLWHNALPMLAYALLLVGGVVLGPRSESALFAIGGAELLLVFIGIHNAWDTVTYVTLLEAEGRARGGAQSPADAVRDAGTAQRPMAAVTTERSPAPRPDVF